MRDGDSGRQWAEKLTPRAIKLWAKLTLHAMERRPDSIRQHDIKTEQLVQRVHDKAVQGEIADMPSVTEMVFQYAQLVGKVRLRDFGQTGNRQM